MGAFKEGRLLFAFLFILSLSGLFTNAAAYELSMTISGQKVDFGTVSPKDPPVVIPHVTQIVVVSTGGSWQLSVQANGDFVTTPNPTYTFPVSRLSWALHPATTPEWTPFSTSATTVTTGDATPTTGEVVDLDYKLDIEWSDPGSTMTYQTTITYTVSPGSLDISYAEPNPFNPNIEPTTIHYLLDVESNVSIEILDAGENHVRTLSPNPANPQPAGPQSVVWDGENDSAVIVDDGQYKYLIQDDSNNVIASGVIIVDTGTATVQGTITDATTEDPLSGATVTLFKSDGTQVGSTTSATDPAGFYSFTSVMEGYYYLKVERSSYYPKTSDVFFVSRGGTVTKDIELTHNRSLFLTKEADINVAAIGDIIKYEVKLQNIGFGGASEARVEDQLPPGFIYIPGTSEIAGEGPVEPTKSGNLFIWEIGELAEGETVTLTYMVAVGFDTELGDRTNRAFAFGKIFGEEVTDGPASAPVRIRGGLFRREGTIIGRAFFDDNGNDIQDEEEKGAPQVEIILDDGTHVITDEFGRYSIPSARPGPHVLKLLNPPPGYRVEGENPKLIDVPTSGLKRANFPLEAGENKPPPLITLIGVAELEAGISNQEPYINPAWRFYLRGGRGGLLTMITFDLDRKEGDRILNISKTNLYYPVYGDSSSFDKKALPVGKVFVHVEQGSSFLRYGRYDVRFERPEFTKYTRSLPGTIAHLKGASHSLSVFHSWTRQVPARDELEAADSPGPYSLTNAPIVPSSELVKIVIRDKDDPTEIIKVEEKEPDKDYTINPDTGKITFVEPIPSEDPSENPVFIIVNYEFIPVGAAPYLIIGGRGELSIANMLQLGATYVEESQSPENYRLGGLSVALNLGNIALNTEFAKSAGNLYDLAGSPVSSAGKASLEVGLTGRFLWGLYYRRVEPNFINLTNPIPRRDIQELALKISHRLSEYLTLLGETKISNDNVLNEPDRVTNTSFTPIGLNLDFGLPGSSQIGLGYELVFNHDDLTPHEVDERIDSLSFAAKLPFASGNLASKHNVTSYTDITKTGPDTLSQEILVGGEYPLLSNLSISATQEFTMKAVKETGEFLSRSSDTKIGLDFASSDSLSITLEHRQSRNLLQHTGTTTSTASLLSTVQLTKMMEGKAEVEVELTQDSAKPGSLGLTVALGLDNHLAEGLDLSLGVMLAPLVKLPVQSASISLKGNIPHIVSVESTLGFTPSTISSSVKLKSNLSKFLWATASLATSRSGEDSVANAYLGLAYRPLQNDRFNILTKLAIKGVKEAGSTVASDQEVSTEVTYELLPELSMSGKLAYKIVSKEGAEVEIGLLSGRATYRLTKRLDLTGETQLYQDVNNNLKSGYRAELGCRLWDTLRIAVGFNLSDPLPALGVNLRRGPFIRLSLVGF